jgi:molybdopterin/thiamine biosynthesis adenylyltransferase
MKKIEKIVLPGIYDDEFYKKRTNRTECFLGVDAKQQQISQDKLSNSVVGIAGAGGIGGMLAMQLIRLGVRHIKLADPDVFDI